MTKSPEMVAALDKISLSMYGRSRSECIANQVCVCCGGPAVEFDEIYSRREFSISGMCQVCQDNFFE